MSDADIVTTRLQRIDSGGSDFSASSAAFLLRSPRLAAFDRKVRKEFAKIAKNGATSLYSAKLNKSRWSVASYGDLLRCGN